MIMTPTTKGLALGPKLVLPWGGNRFATSGMHCSWRRETSSGNLCQDDPRELVSLVELARFKPSKLVKTNWKITRSPANNIIEEAFRLEFCQ
jgi:hypothetical protein